jgi:Uma2 family endonuclease
MPAPPKHLLTAEEFAALPLAGLRSELIEGELHTMPPTFEDHGETTMRLSIILGQYVLANQLGKMYAAETGFLIARNPDTVRAPDIAFIRQERLPSPHPAPRWVPVIPDLVVEVASSGDRPAEVQQKAAMWLDAGVQMVWVVSPGDRTVEVHRANDSGESVVTLHEHETLDGADIVPGFSTPVAAIFG